MSSDHSKNPVGAFGAALLESGVSGNVDRAITILQVLDGKITGKLRGSDSSEGDDFLEFAVLVRDSRPDLALLAIEIYRRAWPTANSGIEAEQQLRASQARVEARSDYAKLDHASALAEYRSNKDATGISERVHAHEAALRAYELMPSDVHTLASLAAATRYAPDLSDDEKRRYVAEVVEHRNGKVGFGFLVSVAAMLIDMGGARSARRVLDEVDRRAPGNPHTKMVRARLASMRGDKVEAEYLGSTAFTPRTRTASGSTSTSWSPGFDEWLCGVLRREW